MPLLFNKYLTKKEYLARVGDIGQCFGIRPVKLEQGKADLVRACDVSTAGGLSFTVNESKGLDLFSLSYRGVSFGFVTKAALNSPWISQETGMAYRNSLSAGFMYTAGLSNVGLGCEEDGFYHCTHGNIKNIPAENICRETLWTGDDCTLRIAGDMRDSAFFGRNMLLHREITARVGERRLFIEDTIENQGFKSEQLMLLYHMNIGYPLLDESAVLIAPVTEDEPMSMHTRENDSDYALMIPPVDNNEEYLHALELAADRDGTASAAVWNGDLNLGLYIRYNSDILRRLIEWKCMSSGDYALGILPSTCKPIGRAGDRAEGEPRYVQPFETVRTKLEIGVLDGAADFETFKAGLPD